MSSTLTGDESAVARLLLDVAGDTAGRQGRPVWVMVMGDPADPTGLALHGDGFDPLGWRAPPDCRIFGMVGTGRVRPLDDGVELAANLAGGRSGGVRLACVVSRSGRVGWHMVLPDGSTFDQVPEEGRALDVLKRCLGLPTPAPAAPTIRRLYHAAWLAAILDQPPGGRLLSWSAALDLHPVLWDRPGGPDPAAKEEAIGMLEGRWTWEDLRVAVAGGFSACGLPEPALAAWMDAGMFARWVLDGIRDPEDLLGQARGRLRPAAARRLAHLIHAAGEKTL
ncbi:MAG TPA: hypothetical protein VFN68_04430 [Acidimicrobiales bacterium]|nr:hypothetical protein [Acidimicrobiales bacterium]